MSTTTSDETAYGSPLGLGRTEHLAPKRLIQSLDPAFMERFDCRLGGGAAAVFDNAEYRRCTAVELFCTDMRSFEILAETMVRCGVGTMFVGAAGIDGSIAVSSSTIACTVHVDGVEVEATVVPFPFSCDGADGDVLHVPALSLDDQITQKLLAVADSRRSAADDYVSSYRDAIDLSYLLARSGMVPETSLLMAEAARGPEIEVGLREVVDLLTDVRRQVRLAFLLDMDCEDVLQAVRRLKDAVEMAFSDTEKASVRH